MGYFFVEGAKTQTEVAVHLILSRQRQNMKGNDSTVQGKTKHIFQLQQIMPLDLIKRDVTKTAVHDMV